MATHFLHATTVAITKFSQKFPENFRKTFDSYIISIGNKMKLNRKQLRKLILREMAGKFLVEPSTYRPEESPGLNALASEIKDGYIIDLSEMEGSGGGQYPLYAVMNGGLSLLNGHIGADLANEILDAEGDYIGYIFDYVEKYDGDEEFDPADVENFGLYKSKMHIFPKANMLT